LLRVGIGAVNWTTVLNVLSFSDFSSATVWSRVVVENSVHIADVHATKLDTFVESGRAV